MGISSELHIKLRLRVIRTEFLPNKMLIRYWKALRTLKHHTCITIPVIYSMTTEIRVADNNASGIQKTELRIEIAHRPYCLDLASAGF